MMAFPSMLESAAKQAGMSVPPEPDDDFDIEKFPHFHVFCLLQPCRPIQWGEHWENAKIIAAIPAKKLKTMTLEDFLAKGLRWQQ